MTLVEKIMQAKREGVTPLYSADLLREVEGYYATHSIDNWLMVKSGGVYSECGYSTDFKGMCHYIHVKDIFFDEVRELFKREGFTIYNYREYGFVISLRNVPYISWGANIFTRE